MRFLHIADIHLGYQQYGLNARFDDFSRTFIGLVEEAQARGVDFVLLAGDLFHKRTVNPLAMRVAVAGLEALRDADIPVLAVEGNHEKAYYRDQYSWVEFLDALGYVKLLNPSFSDGSAALMPHGDEGGAYVDLPGGVRVYGLKYYGASTSTALAQFAEALAHTEASGVRYTILMMHAGLEGQLSHVGRLRTADLAPLRELIDYVALGHIHKPYEVEKWIYNPGSPESCSIQEQLMWPDRGAYWVELRPGEDPPHRAERWAPERRPFFRFRIEVDGLTSPQAVYDRVSAILDREASKGIGNPAPVVELMFTGMLPFNRYELDLNLIQSMVEEAWDPLAARLQTQITPAEFEIDVEARASRSELERTILEQLIARDQRYRGDAAAWTQGARQLKEMVLSGSAPEVVVDHLRRLRREIGATPEGGASEGASSPDARGGA